MSAIRKHYFIRLFFRIAVFFVCLALCFLSPEQFEVLNGMAFFKKFSLFHLLWLVWAADMFMQIIPVKNRVALGSQKLFANRFRPIREKISREKIKAHILTATGSAYLVFIIWGALVAALGILYHFDIINNMWLFMISVLFYVCDLICVLIWCPFRLIMKNKCCTTCRIFNWDHIMMFSPLIFVGGFFSISLVIMAGVAWAVWELAVLIYPERFTEISNAALKCSECTDKLCTQYCQKIRYTENRKAKSK